MIQRWRVFKRNYHYNYLTIDTMAKKSLLITYLLWLCGGVFGLHHFYLGRDFHALVWWMFAGGYFGLGFIRDLWRIPEYVKDANEESSYMEELGKQMRKHERPPISNVRYFGHMTVGDAFGFLVLNAIPLEFVSDGYYLILRAIFMPFAVAVGVYLIGNIGRHEGKFINALIGAYITCPIFLIGDAPRFITLFGSCFYFNKYRKWRRTPKPQKSFASRVKFLTFCGTIYLMLWGSWFYFNCSVASSEDEEPVKCRDAAKHFFTSPIWNEFLNVMKEIWRSVQEHGWREVWRQLIGALDPTGETNALKVLGLNSASSQQEISGRYRKLSREWHPDKHRDPEKKQIAQEQFIAIQHAYEILSKIKSQRMAQNVKNPAVITEDVQSEETVYYREDL